MTRWQVRKNDILRCKRTGVTFIVSREGYTYRFMESEDYDMQAHGMGEYAGVYGTAVDITSTETGKTFRRKIAAIRDLYENLTALEEAA